MRLWQALGVLAAFVQPPHIRPAVQAMIPLLASNHPANVKQYMEGTVAGLLRKHVRPGRECEGRRVGDHCLNR